MKNSFKPPRAKPGEVNYHFFDRFTIAHFAIGILYAVLDFHFITMFMLAVGWEIIEDFLKANVKILFPHSTSDTWANRFGDVIAVIVGWLFGLSQI